MKYYLYAVALFTKKDKKPNGSMVKLVESKDEGLESEGIRCYTLKIDTATFSRWNNALSSCDDGTGWAVIPQTEAELLAKITGKELKPFRNPDWEDKIEEYKAWPGQNETSTRYLSSRQL
ncbi:hypothetical protein [Acinetobacter phage ABPH49]|nr:hypothetical protein [Acinetobacter phage ABPH49]